MAFAEDRFAHHAPERHGEAFEVRVAAAFREVGCGTTYPTQTVTTVETGDG